MIKTKDINLFVFDEKKNFEKTKNSLGYEGVTIKQLFCIQTLAQFNEIIEEELNDNDLFFLVVHVFGKTENLQGIVDFKASGIKQSYPKLPYLLISEGNKREEIQDAMYNNKFQVEEVYKYHQMLDELGSGKHKILSKEILLSNGVGSENLETPKLKFDYAIITALEEDEMEKVLPMIENEVKIQNSKHLIYYGNIKNKPEKKVIYSSQQSSGMIDAAILATELLQYKPKYLIMAGVLGGRPDKTNIGDVVVATKTFTIDKGKIDELGFHKESESSSNEGDV